MIQRALNRTQRRKIADYIHTHFGLSEMIQRALNRTQRRKIADYIFLVRSSSRFTAASRIGTL